MTKKKPQPSKLNKSVAVPEKKKTGSSTTIPKWVWIGAVLLLTFIAFYPSLNCGFVHWDDQLYVSESELIKSLSFENIARIFSTESTVALNYHPLTILSLAIDYQFAKTSPFHYHLVNVLIHLLNTFLVFLFAYRLSGRKLFTGLIVSLFFGIHPMHVESVTWIAERKDVLYTFFFIGALLCYLSYSDSKKNKILIFTFLLFLFSVLSKAMGVVFPLVMLLIDFYKGRKITMKVVAEKIPFLIISIVFGMLALHVQANEEISVYYQSTFFHRMCFGFYGFFSYVWKLFLPVNLSSFYPYPVANAGGTFPLSFYIPAFCGIIFFLLISLLFILRNEKMKLIAFGTGFYFVTIITVLQFFSVGGAIMSDRYSYIPFIGLLFIIGMMLNNFIEKNTSAKIPVAIGITIIALIFSYITHERTKVWKDAETLWANVIDQYPSPPYKIGVAYQANLGNTYAEKGQELLQAGDSIHAIENFNKSITYFSAVLAFDSSSLPMLINRAMVYMFLKNYDLAAVDYNKALMLDPDNIELMEKRANVYFKLNRRNEALGDYDKLISLAPGKTSLFHYRGMVRLNMGMQKEAIEDFKVIIQREPQNGKTYYLLSICYNSIGDNTNALVNAEKAINSSFPIEPGYIESLRNNLKK